MPETCPFDAGVVIVGPGEYVNGHMLRMNGHDRFIVLLSSGAVVALYTRRPVAQRYVEQLRAVCPFQPMPVTVCLGEFSLAHNAFLASDIGWMESVDEAEVEAKGAMPPPPPKRTVYKRRKVELPV